MGIVKERLKDVPEHAMHRSFVQLILLLERVGIIP